MNRKPMPQKPALAEEEISEDLLDNIPELHDAKHVPFTVLADDEDDAPAVDTLVSAAPGFTPPHDAPRPVPYPLGGGSSAPEPLPIKPTPFPLGGGTAAPVTPAAPSAPVSVDEATLNLDVHGLVDQARTLMENAFQAELSRVETTYGQFLKQMESQLKQAELELAAVQAEHAKVKSENDKKADALRELKKALESI